MYFLQKSRVRWGKKNLSTHDVAGGLSAIVCGISPSFAPWLYLQAPASERACDGWMDGWMWLVGVFHHDFPWGNLSVGRAQPPQRWYLLQTRQLTDSSPLCIFPQRRTVLICFLYGIFYYNPYMTFRFPVLHPKPKKMHEESEAP